MTNPINSGNGWMEYKRLVLNEIERANDNLGELRHELVGIREQLAFLKGKAGVWGAMGGLVIGGVVSLVVGMLFK